MIHNIEKLSRTGFRTRCYRCRSDYRVLDILVLDRRVQKDIN